ncbi:hypothetical protein [Helicobacter suis]|uniref:hypothetical protein n=1 Tax=Helicobacter suis TaxID=104628 RepID=UPI002200E453|nr:hypothetical protein [Helicobacter suis]BDR27397.1 hypothetical protein HSHS1_01580 [Helicobacter suis HS1]
MDFSKALQKLNDRISGLNVMRGRLIKFVNPTQADTQTPAPYPFTQRVLNTIKSALSLLSLDEKQERHVLDSPNYKQINRLIRTRNITNNDLAPLGLHFENIEVYEGVVWRNNELTQAFKDYMRSMDSISAFAVVYESIKNAPLLEN